MGSEKVKLMALLNYWISHNKEHSREFREWADKARGFCEVEVPQGMVQAAQEMDKAGESLSCAVRRLEAKER
jgi:hypothetical protein